MSSNKSIVIFPLTLDQHISEEESCIESIDFKGNHVGIKTTETVDSSKVRAFSWNPSEVSKCSNVQSWPLKLLLSASFP